MLFLSHSLDISGVLYLEVYDAWNYEKKTTDEHFRGIVSGLHYVATDGKLLQGYNNSSKFVPSFQRTKNKKE